MTDGRTVKPCRACGAVNEVFDWAGENWDCTTCDVRQIFYRPQAKGSGCAHHGRDVGQPCDVCGKVRES